MLSTIPEGIKAMEVEGKGLGVTALRVYEKDEFVCEYKGELISKSVGEEREEHYPDDKCFLYYFEFKSKKLW